MSKRSASIKSRNSRINLNRPSFQDNYLEKILEKEEDDMIPYEIRDEIINNVLDQIYEKHLEKRKISYVLECTYEAMVKLLEIEFYFHHISEPYYVNHPLWTPDNPPEPSEPDTMCYGKVETQKRIPVEVEPEEMEEMGVYAEDELFSVPSFIPPQPAPSVCQDETTTRKTGSATENDFSDIDFDEDILKYLLGQQITESIEEDKISIPYVDSKLELKREAGIDGILNEILDQVLRETEGSEKSFVKFAKTLKLSGTCKLSKKPLKHKPALKLPKIDVPEPRKLSEKPELLTTLPPIRLNTDFNVSQKAKEEPEPEKPKKSQPRKKW
ncbi:unnamed protein product [Brassicogethes aeneus]|uniref:Uncharacterized protein n=1 Tax=Brassicogethes aeneus TaxID=1431903 RepID=A0A9P0BK18_BRAAE|nr:unnamed protein product [Brassicogethes aeneus]